MKVVHFLGLILVGMAKGTPDASLVVHERVLGCGKEFYAVMRFEILNRGSYYEWEERTYLDEYLKRDQGRKGVQGRKLLKSTLMLETKWSFPDADTSKPLKKEVVARDDRVSLGEVVEAYPPVITDEWSIAEHLKVTEGGWIYFGDEIPVLSRDQLIKVFSKGEWNGGHLESVRPAPGGGLFLKLSNRTDDSDHTSYQKRVVFVSEALRQQMVDLEERLETYLMLGEFESLEEARALVDRIKKVAKEKKGFSIRPQIWLRKHSTWTRYRVVAGESDNALRRENYQTWDKAFGVKVLPVKGTSLKKRIYRE